MYAPTVLHEHYDALEKAFHALFLEFQTDPAGETIHQLRVNIKQQIAFFRILRALESHLPLEEIQAPFAAFFKSIGKIRNLEIRQQLLTNEEKKYQVADSYSNKIQEKISTEKLWWTTETEPLSLIPFRQVSHKVKSSIDRLPLENLKETLGEYFYFLIAEIRKTVSQETVKIEQLHDLRKLLKVLFFNLKLTDRLISQTTIPATLYKKLTRYNNILGEWHDQFITVYKLSYKKQKVDKQVLKMLKKKERTTRKEIIGSFPAIGDFISKLEKGIFHLFAQEEPVHIPPRRFKEEKYQEIRESLNQLNLMETIR